VVILEPQAHTASVKFPPSPNHKKIAAWKMAWKWICLSPSPSIHPTTKPTCDRWRFS